MNKILKETLSSLLIMIVSMGVITCLALPLLMMFAEQFWWLLLIPIGLFLGNLQHNLIIKDLKNE